MVRIICKARPKAGYLVTRSGGIRRSRNQNRGRTRSRSRRQSCGQNRSGPARSRGKIRSRGGIYMNDICQIRRTRIITPRYVICRGKATCYRPLLFPYGADRFKADGDACAAARGRIDRYGVTQLADDALAEIQSDTG